MTRYEVQFRLRHDCPLNNLSRKYPSVMMVFWCNFDRDILEVIHSRATRSEEFRSNLDSMLHEIGGHPHRQTSSSASLQIVTRCDNLKLSYATSRIFSMHNCLSIQPSFHTEGWEWYRVIAFSATDMKELFADLDRKCEVEVLSKRKISDGAMRDSFVVSTSNLFSHLSGKQMDVLDYAISSGFYSVPKKATSRELARRLSVPRQTFEEHLRKAESKVMQSMAPYVQLMSRPKKRD
jgi:predicted DNA binding protein